MEGRLHRGASQGQREEIVNTFLVLHAVAKNQTK
jgi:hypothetical protein